MGFVVVPGGALEVSTRRRRDMLCEEEDPIEEWQIVEEKGGRHVLARKDLVLRGNGGKHGRQK